MGTPHFTFLAEEGNRGSWPSQSNSPGHFGIADKACSFRSSELRGKISTEKDMYVAEKGKTKSLTEKLPTPKSMRSSSERLGKAGSLLKKKWWGICSLSTYSEMRESKNENMSGEGKDIEREKVSLRSGQSFFPGMIIGKISH